MRTKRITHFAAAVMLGIIIRLLIGRLPNEVVTIIDSLVDICIMIFLLFYLYDSSRQPDPERVPETERRTRS
ncbi:MAG: hypothetical protein KatS3mg019_0778 [Fimbriimonadales bacterium]|nr:MAG: hypothetical protein KatS3mg019_0778 [Fimbriimonadales bacterium]